MVITETSKMRKQKTITSYFKVHSTEEVDMECNKAIYIKEEIDIDWDERDNFYETKSDNTKTDSSKATILKRPPNAIIKTNTDDNRRQITKKCLKCNKVFEIQTYKNHIRHCGKERNLQCAHCPYKTKYKEHLIRHIHQLHPKGSETISATTHNEEGITKYCQECDKIINKVQHLTNCEKCLSKLIYQCSKCKKMFDKYKPAYYHWSTRCGVRGYYYCNLCDYKAVCRSKVKSHLKKFHKNSQSCEMMTWKSLFNYGETQASSSYQCQKCGKPMSNDFKLKKHMSFCKGVGNVEKFSASSTIIDFDPTICSTCGKKFQHVYQLNKHSKACMEYQHALRRITDNEEEIVEVVEDHPPLILIAPEEIHEDIKQRAIKFCNTCQVESDFEVKWGKTNGKQKLPCLKCKSYLVFKCKKCFKEFPTINCTINHLKLVCISGEEYECTKCNFKGKSATAARRHYKLVHVDISKECTRCGKVFKNSSRCRIHSQRCGVEPKFQCEHCPYKSKFKDVLKKHIFCRHMDLAVIDKGALIKIKNQRFSRSLKQLKAHCSKCKMKQLLKNRLKICKNCKTKLNIKCTPCNKSFSADDKDTCDHVNAYLQMIKFECKRCGRGFISKGSLGRHKSLCGIQFSCRFCKFVSNFKLATKRHEKTKHPDEV